MTTWGGIATPPLKQLWRKDPMHFKNQRSRRLDLAVPARTIVAFESIVSVFEPTCHVPRNVHAETAVIWNHESTQAIRCRDSHCEFTYFFWTVVRTVDVSCRTKWPKFLDLVKRLLVFRTVLHRSETGASFKNAAILVFFRTSVR